MVCGESYKLQLWIVAKRTMWIPYGRKEHPDFIDESGYYTWLFPSLGHKGSTRRDPHGYPLCDKDT